MLHRRCQVWRPIGQVRGKNVVGHDDDPDIDHSSHQVFSQMHHVDRQHVAAAGYLHFYSDGCAACRTSLRPVDAS